MSISLNQCLSEKSIKLNVKCDNWEGAIKKAGQILLDNDVIEAKYIDSMIGYVNKFGPYIVLLPGFALAHARPENGAKKTGISLITLEEPVCFGNEDNDPVYVVVAIATTSDEGHLQFLGDICSAIKDEERLHNLLECSSAKEVVDFFTKSNTEK